VVNTKSRPLDLEGEVLPELIRKCGDVKSGRITVQGVEAFLDQNVLIFDRTLVKNLFAEADFKQEGSLNALALKAALSARYPKRQLHREWRKLAALLLGMPELVFADDVKEPKYYNGTFNKGSVWDEPPKALPKAGRRRKAHVKKDKGDWASTTSTLQASGKLDQTGTSSMLLTTQGLKSTVCSAAENAVNSSGLQADQPRSTFSAVADFERLQRSQALSAALGSSNKALPPLTLESIMGSSKKSVKAWSAALPPSTISLSSSALLTLRASVRGTMTQKSDFQLSHPPLTASELDLKKTLGQPLDVTLAMNRVFPTRPTNVLPRATYTEWGDYASTCRTAPTRWYNEFPQ